MPVSTSAPSKIIAPPKQDCSGCLRLSNHAAKPPSNPHIATEEPAPTGFQIVPASSPTRAPVRYKISQRTLPNIRSTRKPTIAMPEKLKTICHQPSGLKNIGVIKRHHWPEASMPGVRWSVTTRPGKRNCRTVITPVIKRTARVALGFLGAMVLGNCSWNAPAILHWVEDPRDGGALMMPTAPRSRQAVTISPLIRLSPQSAIMGAIS